MRVLARQAEKDRGSGLLGRLGFGDSSIEQESIVEELGDETVEKDKLTEVINNERRRWATKYAAESTNKISLRELSDARAEIEWKRDESWNDARQRVYIALYQQHLPKLVDAGVLVERSGNVYDRGPNAAALAGFVRLLDWLCDAEQVEATKGEVDA